MSTVFRLVASSFFIIMVSSCSYFNTNVWPNKSMHIELSGGSDEENEIIKVVNNFAHSNGLMRKGDFSSSISDTQTSAIYALRNDDIIGRYIVADIIIIDASPGPNNTFDIIVSSYGDDFSPRAQLLFNNLYSELKMNWPRIVTNT